MHEKIDEHAVAGLDLEGQRAHVFVDAGMDESSFVLVVFFAPLLALLQAVLELLDPLREDENCDVVEGDFGHGGRSISGC